jgi:hypothetical protein
MELAIIIIGVPPASCRTLCQPISAHHVGVAMFRLFASTMLGVAMSGMLTACSTPPPPPAPLPPVLLDGTYSGVMQLSRGDAITCGNNNPITVQIQNRMFNYNLAQPQAEWKPMIAFAVAIGPDGSFNARSGPDSMSGSVANGSMNGDIIGDTCAFSFSAGRVGN